MHDALWTDLIIACAVIFVVLAPARFFRVKEAPAASSPSSTKSAPTRSPHSRLQQRRSGTSAPLIGRNNGRSRVSLAVKHHHL